MLRKISIDKNDTIEKAIDVMASEKVSGLAVVENDIVIGVLSGKDCFKAILQSKYYNLDIGNVQNYMTSNPDLINEELNPQDYQKKFVDGNHHYYPVLKNGKFIGTIYRIDLLIYLNNLEQATWFKKE